MYGIYNCFLTPQRKGALQFVKFTFCYRFMLRLKNFEEMCLLHLWKNHQILTCFFGLCLLPWQYKIFVVAKTTQNATVKGFVHYDLKNIRIYIHAQPYTGTVPSYTGTVPYTLSVYEVFVEEIIIQTIPKVLLVLHNKVLRLKPLLESFDQDLW